MVGSDLTFRRSVVNEENLLGEGSERTPCYRSGTGDDGVSPCREKKDKAECEIDNGR